MCIDGDVAIDLSPGEHHGSLKAYDAAELHASGKLELTGGDQGAHALLVAMASDEDFGARRGDLET